MSVQSANHDLRSLLSGRGLQIATSIWTLGQHASCDDPSLDGPLLQTPEFGSELTLTATQLAAGLRFSDERGYTHKMSPTDRDVLDWRVAAGESTLMSVWETCWQEALWSDGHTGRVSTPETVIILMRLRARIAIHVRDLPLASVTERPVALGRPHRPQALVPPPRPRG